MRRLGPDPADRSPSVAGSCVLRVIAWTVSDCQDRHYLARSTFLRVVLTDALPEGEVTSSQGFRRTGPHDALLWFRVAGDENPLRDQVRRQVEHNGGTGPAEGRHRASADPE